MERCPPPSGRRLIFSACNNLYRENNGLVASRVQRKVRYFIHYSDKDIELDYESDIEEFCPKIVVRVFQKKFNSRKLLGFTFFFNVFNFYVFKERTVNCAVYNMTSHGAEV